MEAEFYRDRFTQHGIETIVPNPQQCEIIDTIIFDELVFGTIKDASRTIYVDIMKDLIKRGAQGIVLGCTEIKMLVKPQDVELKLFDTTTLHCQKAINLALTIDEISSKFAKNII